MFKLKRKKLSKSIDPAFIEIDFVKQFQTQGARNEQDHPVGKENLQRTKI